MKSMHESVLDSLEAAKSDWPRIAKATGIPISTIKKIAYRQTKDPGVSRIERLAAFFRRKAA